jgi:aminomethyltransferase
MDESRCRYSLVCNERGGVIDDVIVYRFEDKWQMVVNAANREKVLAHFGEQVGDLAVKIEDQTFNTAMVAVQGPQVMEFIGRFSSEVPALKRYAFCTKNLLVLKMTISRTGYTGENGVEVILPASMAPMALKLLVRDGDQAAAVVKPCGLGARDTLRIEAAMPLYGHELSEDIDPLTAGLGFAVSLDKGDDDRTEPFVGQAALRQVQEAGPGQQRIGLRLEGRRTARQHAAVRQGEQSIGEVTSACLSPTLGQPIAMAYVEAGSCRTGDVLAVEVGRRAAEAEVVDLPFYKPSGK